MDGKLPLAICKQICMKFDSVLSDIHEIMEDSDIELDVKCSFSEFAEITSAITESIYTMVSKEMSIGDFIADEIELDDIDDFDDIILDDIEEYV